jgi:hypothetical protein
MGAVPWDLKAGAFPLLMFGVPCMAKTAWLLSPKRKIRRRNSRFGSIIPYPGDAGYLKNIPANFSTLPVFQYWTLP